MFGTDSGADPVRSDRRPDPPSRRDIWKMFDRIAARYDLLNHLLSADIDKRWRRRLATMLPGGGNLSVLDLATGTGDQLLTLAADGRVTNGIGIDLAEQMLAVGREKIRRLNLDRQLSLQHGDAENIPFNTNRFDAATIAFGIRNMTDVRRTLIEMHRVLKPGGRALILEFSLPRNTAYRYLNETIETFPHGTAFCELMTKAGFSSVKHTPLTMGVATIYCGDKK